MENDLKACPFCGGKMYAANGFWACDADIQLCHFSGLKLTEKDLNSAYCWKRISELESELSSRIQQSNSWAEAATKANEKVEELARRFEIETMKSENRAKSLIETAKERDFAREMLLADQTHTPCGIFQENQKKKIELLESELKKEKLVSAEWCEKWTDAGHRILELEKELEKVCIENTNLLGGLDRTTTRIKELKTTARRLFKILKHARQGYECFLSDHKNCGCETETTFLCGYHRDLNEIEDGIEAARPVLFKEGQKP